MNLNELFKPQEELDQHIKNEHDLEGQDLTKKKTVALLTELFECTNEARFFKFWSHDQRARTKALKRPTMNDDDKEYYNPLLEEYADTVHFTVSLANDFGYTEHKYTDPGHIDLNDLVIGLTNLITLLPETRSHRQIELVFNYLIRYGYQLGFTEEQVIEAYYSKNEENHERQVNHY